MSTVTASVERGPSAAPLLSRQPQCPHCHHEQHWLGCEWCGCRARPATRSEEAIPADRRSSRVRP